MTEDSNSTSFQRDIESLKNKLAEMESLLHQKDEFEDRINDIKTNLIRIEHTRHLGSWKYNPQKNTIYCSAGMMTFLGLEPIEKRWSFAEFKQMIHPEDRDFWSRAIHKAIHEQRVHECEYRIIRADNKVFYLREEGELETGVNVRNQYFLCIVHPMNSDGSFGEENQQKMQRELEETQNLLAFHCENSPLAILDWDINFRLKRWSKSARNIFGWKESEVLGRSWDDLPLFHEKDFPLFQESIQSFLRCEKQNEIITTRNHTKDGRVIYCEWYFSVFCVENVPETILSQVQDITQRKKAELDIHQNEERYRTLFEQSSMGIFESTPDGKILQANQAYARMFGYDDSEDVIRSIQDIAQSIYVYPEIRSEIIHDVLQTDRMIEREVLYRKKNGTHFTGLLRVQSIRDQHNQFLYLFGFVEDITDRKRAEYALRESEERFRTIFERSSLGIYETSPEGHFYRANKAFARMFGFESPQDVLNSIHDIPSQLYYYPEERAPLVQKVLNKHGVLETEIEFKRKDGSPFTGSIRMQAVHDVRGSAYLFGFVEDVTERKRNEEELRKSKQLLQSILDSTPALIFIKDQNGCFVMVNHSFVQFANTPMDRIIGFTDDDVFPQFDMSTVKENDQKVLRSNSLMEFEEILESDDTRRIFLSIKVPLEDVGFHEKVVLGVATDITDRKRSEKQRIKLESQLHQSHKMEAVGRLAGGIAHNINNLLTGIIGNLGLVESDVRNQSKKYIQEALKAAEQSSTLVQQLLAFSRKSLISPKPIDINEVLDEVYLLVRPSIERRIDMEMIKESHLPYVYADQAQLTTVLMNLCMNARDAIDELKKSEWLQHRDTYRFVIQIKTERCTISSSQYNNHTDSYAGDFIRVSISDNGIGMDEQTQKYIFEPFFTTKDVGKGTGLGLASSFGIIKQHDGWMDIQTQIGKGSTFMVYLPVTQQTRSKSESTISTDVEPGNETILFVDDERMIRNLTETILTKQGYKILAAQDGEEGLNIYLQNKESVDLVVLDLSMPKLSGLEVSRKIREVDPDMKILFSSGYQEMEGLDYDHRNSDLITKPYRSAVLMKKIRALLDS